MLQLNEVGKAISGMVIILLLLIMLGIFVRESEFDYKIELLKNGKVRVISDEKQVILNDLDSLSNYIERDNQ